MITIYKHINQNNITYYSKIENGKIIFSFSPDFEDIWSEDDEKLYGIKTS